MMTISVDKKVTYSLNVSCLTLQPFLEINFTRPISLDFKSFNTMFVYF